jgi:hypothetical protein
VLADRGRYIAAALTITRAYLIAGCPGLLPPLASFDGWSRAVRSPLVWLDYTDPVETMEAARADDPSRANLRALFAAWRNVIGLNKPKTVGEIRNYAVSSDNNDPDGILFKAARRRGSAVAGSAAAAVARATTFLSPDHIRARTVCCHPAAASVW